MLSNKFTSFCIQISGTYHFQVNVPELVHEGDLDCYEWYILAVDSRILWYYRYKSIMQ